jgi:CRP/FNR family transcriptional regulator, cyclic AMP receptor protein
MPTPHALELHENCAACCWRSKGFFCNVPLVELKSFQAVKYTKAYPPAAILFAEGQTSRGVYLLCKGRIKLAMTSPDGKTVILRFAEPGELLGLNSTITGGPYEFTAETMEPCQVNFVMRKAFLRILAEDRAFWVQVTEQLSSDCSTACKQIRSLALSQSAVEKMARFLLDRAAKGRQTNRGIQMNLPFTHEDIGQAVGVTRETATRTLTELKNRMLITSNGTTLVILNRPGLQALVAA